MLDWLVLFERSAFLWASCDCILIYITISRIVWPLVSLHVGSVEGEVRIVSETAAWQNLIKFTHVPVHDLFVVDILEWSASSIGKTIFWINQQINTACAHSRSATLTQQFMALQGFQSCQDSAHLMPKPNPESSRSTTTNQSTEQSGQFLECDQLMQSIAHSLEKD